MIEEIYQFTTLDNSHIGLGFINRNVYSKTSEQRTRMQLTFASSRDKTDSKNTVKFKLTYLQPENKKEEKSLKKFKETLFSLQQKHSLQMKRIK